MAEPSKTSPTSASEIGSQGPLDPTHPPGQFDLREPNDARAFLMWLETGDKNERPKKGQPPPEVPATLEKTAPIPPGK